LSLAVLALGFAATVVTPADAQSDAARKKKAGVVVQIDGDGGAIVSNGASVIIRGTASSIEVAGAMVDIQATVSGPVSAAGAQVTIDGKTDGNLRAAGGLIEVRGTAGGDSHVAGAVVRFDADATGDVNAIGATVNIGPDASIGGELSAAGASVTVAGTTTGAVSLAGAGIVFNGKAAGDVTAAGDEIVIGANATIGGDLIVKSDKDPVIEVGATITGQVRLEEPSQWWAFRGWLWTLAGAVVVALGAILTGAILLLIGRGTFEEGLANATFRPISSGLIGLATMIVLPIVAVLLMTTVIGLSFGVALMMVLPFLLVAGHALVAACIGVWILDRQGEPRTAGQLILYMIAGAIVLAIVWLIPWVGAPIALLAMLVGTGAYLRALSGRLRRRTIAPA
jgi:hypothetical protein